MKTNNQIKGIILITASAFFFSLMGLFVRLSGDLPSIEKGFFRNAVAMLFALAIILKDRKGFSVGKGNIPVLILRSVFGTAGIIFNFYAIDHLVLADANMLNKMSPFFVLVCSAVFLKEKLRPHQLLVVIAAFTGSLFILKPSFENISFFPAFIGLLGGLGAGAAYTCVRYLGTRGVRGPVIVLFFSTFSCLSCFVLMIADFKPMSAYQLLMLCLAGLSAAFGQFSITAAYTYAPAREISVYDYSAIIFSTIWGLAFFDQIPDFLSIIGYLIICGAAVINFVKNSKQITTN